MANGEIHVQAEVGKDEIVRSIVEAMLNRYSILLVFSLLYLPLIGSVTIFLGLDAYAYTKAWHRFEPIPWLLVFTLAVLPFLMVRAQRKKIEQDLARIEPYVGRLDFKATEEGLDITTSGRAVRVSWEKGLRMYVTRAGLLLRRNADFNVFLPMTAIGDRYRLREVLTYLRAYGVYREHLVPWYWWSVGVLVGVILALALFWWQICNATC